jgi:phosphoenolpyruvate carboxylase
MVGVSPELQALADASPDHRRHRSDEPYRRALIGIYARLASTARALGATNILRKEVGHAEPYADAAEFSADLQVLIDSLNANHGAAGATPRLATAAARRRDLRLPPGLAGHAPESDVHERVLAELFAAPAGRGRLRRVAGRRRQGRAAAGELAQPRLLYSPYISYSDETDSELGVLRAAREIRARYGARAIRNYIISHTEKCPTCWKCCCCKRKPACCAAPKPAKSDRT